MTFSIRKAFFAGLLLATAVGPAIAQHNTFKAWVLAKFPDTPEGLALDAKGNMYATLFHTGEVIKLKDDGTYEHIAWVPSKEEGSKGVLQGLEFDKDGNMYTAFKARTKYDSTEMVDPLQPACKVATVTSTGVYKIEVGTNKVIPLATKADGWPFCHPDDIAIDKSGNLYVTDLTYAGIWKISPDGKQVDLWSSSPLLNWSSRPYSGYTIGVNDLALDKEEKNIIAVTDGDPMIVRIPIRDDGSAGEAKPLLPGGASAYDGVEIDDKDNIYVSEIVRSEIWVYSPDGSQRILIANKANAPLDGNSSLILKGNVLCTSNLGFPRPNPRDADRTIVCMKGFSVPK